MKSGRWPYLILIWSKPSLGGVVSEGTKTLHFPVFRWSVNISEVTVPDCSLQFHCNICPFFLLLNFPFIPDSNSHFMLFMPCDTDTEEMCSHSQLCWCGKQRRGSLDVKKGVLIVWRSRQTEMWKLTEWEAQGSVSTQGLCEALLMLGGLLDFVGLRVSGSSPRATRCWSFRPSNFSYHDQASRGCKMQEQALHSTCAQQCHTWSASMALWGSVWASSGAARKHCADFPVVEKALHQADTCLKESN